MITFERGNNKFIFRVAGLTIHNNKILIHQYEGYDFWALPELQENTIETIKREIKEELDEDITVERLLWCCENFYEHEEHFITYED